MNSLLDKIRLSEVSEMMWQEKHKLEKGEVTPEHARAFAELADAMMKFVRFEMR